MSRQDVATRETSAAARGMREQGRGGGPMRAMGLPVEKSLNFWPSARRLMGRMASERWMLGLVALLAVGSVSMSVLGPTIFGRATDIIFRGVIGARLPANITVEQAAADALCRAAASTSRHCATSSCWPWSCTCWPLCSAGFRATF